MNVKICEGKISLITRDHAASLSFLLLKLSNLKIVNLKFYLQSIPDT